MRRFHLRNLPLAVAALCSAMSPTLWAQVQPGALPTGWNVTGGNASISQNGTTLNINQTSSQALVNFQTFNVGSGAVVDIRQPNAQSALLARTVGGSASQIQGQIKANGALWLINPAGIMVGAGARIDVGSFVASTLNVSDSDFLAGRLTFKSTAGAGEVRNAGTINAASGGSIYLVGPSVVNTGLLNAPNGEVLLAAGQNVELMDTGTPGVSVAISGAAGEAKNLGRIVAEAGRIGLAAGLVSNSGEIRADSAVREGGRVFLRASGDLKTSATSNISASGTTGGRVELIADGAAVIDGHVAATGSAGKGGYVDTSGHRSLDVVNVPVVGRGGEWHIDPYDIEIVAAGPDIGYSGSNAIVSNESGARISADTITAQLNAGVDVSITTGAGNPATDPWLGDITVSAAIAKSGNLDSTLTLNASNNIFINAPITSTNSALGLNLNSNYQDNNFVPDHAVRLNADLNLNGGVLNVSEGLGGSGSGNGTLYIGTGTTWLNTPTSAINAAEVHVGTGATLALNRAGSALSGRLVNEGTVSVGGTGTAVLDHGGASWGRFDVADGAGLSFAGAHGFNAGSSFGGTGTVEWAGVVTLGTALVFGPGGNSLVMHDVDLSAYQGGILQTQGADVVVDGYVRLRGAGAWTNAAKVSVQGTGAISAGDEGTRFQNDGIVTTSGTTIDVLRGAGGAVPNFVNNGSLVKTGAGTQEYTGFASTASSVVRAEAGVLNLNGAQFDGQLQIAAGARISLVNASLGSHSTFFGAGDMVWESYITLLGAVEVGAGAPDLWLQNTAISSEGHTLTTRNAVRASQEILLDGTVWNNLGTVSVGADGAAIALERSGSFNNQAGGTVLIDQGVLGANFDEAHVNNGAIVLQAGGTLRTGGTDIYNNGSISGSGTLDMNMDGAASGTLFNNGTVSPGTSTAVGTLAVQGNYTQGSNGALDIKLGGMGAGEFDLLDVDGAARLGGALRINALGAFAPANAAQADVIVARGGSSGLFDQVVTAPVSWADGVATLSVSYPAQGTATRVTAAVVPSFNACVANPALAGCGNVLPTLDACMATPSMAGCSAVLPTASACAVSPSLLGCTAVLPPTPPVPTADLCTIAPNSPLCQVLSPPTASTPVNPVQLATNEVIKTITTMQSPPLGGAPALSFIDTSTTSSESKSEKIADKSADKSDKKEVASTEKSGLKNEPVKKLVCN